MKDAWADYHQDMNAELFEKWFDGQLLPALARTFPGESCVIVMDNAPYHSRLKHLTPSMNMRKDRIVEIMQHHRLAVPLKNNGDVAKKTVLLQAWAQAGIPKVYQLDCDAAKAGHEVLRLPPYWCIFNPIENVWSWVKGTLRTQNASLKASGASLLYQIREVVSSMPQHFWANYCRKARREEDTHMRAPRIEPFIINTEGDSDDSDYSENE
ncbi:uncharacterized protein LOC113215796 [Frankliniella occidentalis]|uniref:Uncharacterized protein LOC113215796 n=1 Tax=Frankliniella occidentalis TaxID=133901 RepID=A0A9C6X9H0_FRAOC|nr:uncharacterized protein LOC113215796 [Frankliniella occidentalis]